MFTTKNKIEFKDCYGKIIYTSKTGRSKEKEYQKAYQEAIRNAFETMEDFTYSYDPLNSNFKNASKRVLESETIKVTQDSKRKVLNDNIIEKDAKNVLYAQTIENGFQLINTKPELLFKVFKTNIKDVYIINNQNGVFYKVGERWVIEYYQNNQLIQKYYQVKF